MKLNEDFLAAYRDAPVPMDAIGTVTMLRTYSARGQESWFDICKRVIEGAWAIPARIGQAAGPVTMQWAERMFDNMFNMRWVPAGRGLQHMGHDRMWKKGSGVLQNCGYRASSDPEWIRFLANMSMLGVGVGFDMSGVGKYTLRANVAPTRRVFAVEDTREGWVDAFDRLWQSLTGGDPIDSVFDLSGIRAPGIPLVTMGGTSAGPDPLGNGLANFANVSGVLTATYNAKKKLVTFKPKAGEIAISSEQILDMGNIVGVCVVSGGIRRSAEIGIFDEGDAFVYEAKRNKEKLYAWRWASNNTIRRTSAPSREQIRTTIQNSFDFGDPGELFLYNVLGKGRTGEDAPRERGAGCNPCVTGDTLVHTEHGSFPVRDLVGRPFTFVHKSLKWASTDAGFWETKRTDKLVRVWFTDGTHVTCTPDHKFITLRGPIEARKLKDGENPFDNFDRVIQHDPERSMFDFSAPAYAHVACVEKVTLPEPVPVYDCSIPGLNYFPANGVMVHNCGEQPLESGELCNLVEICLPRCESQAQLTEVALCALYYGKLVTMLPVGEHLSDEIMKRNRRIGVAVTGFVECMERADWFDQTYRDMQAFDRVISRRHGVPTSVKLTSVKPSGTVSLVLGCSPGVNPHFAPFYFRRMNIEKGSPLVAVLDAAGYPRQENVYTKTSYVYEFPIRAKGPTALTALDQLRNVLILQEKWSDNMVSNTIVFDESEIDEIADFVFEHRYEFKSLAFLKRKHGFEQAVLEEITEDEYNARMSAVSPLDLSLLHGENTHDTDETGCESGKCEVVFS